MIPNNSTVEYTCSDGDFEMFNGSSASNGVKINGSKFSITSKFDSQFMNMFMSACPFDV